MDFNAFMICGEQIAGVEDFVYLGSSLNAERLSASEIRRQLGMARSAVQGTSGGAEAFMSRSGYCAPSSSPLQPMQASQE